MSHWALLVTTAAGPETNPDINVEIKTNKKEIVFLFYFISRSKARAPQKKPLMLRRLPTRVWPQPKPLRRWHGHFFEEPTPPLPLEQQVNQLEKQVSRLQSRFDTELRQAEERLEKQIAQRGERSADQGAVRGAIAAFFLACYLVQSSVPAAPYRSPWGDEDLS